MLAGCWVGGGLFALLQRPDLTGVFNLCDEEAAPPQSALDKARKALARGDGIAAEEQLRASLRDAGATEDVAAYLGEAALLQDDLVTARHWLQPGRFSAATALHGYRMLGRLEMREGNLSVAGAAFDQALSIDSEQADLWVDIGHLRYRGGEQIQAIAAADRADPTAGTLHVADAASGEFRALARDAEQHVSQLAWIDRDSILTVASVGTGSIGVSPLGRCRKPYPDFSA